MTNQSSTDLTSLPKGGGALKGLGETFQPDLHTGTGNYRIPLETPPGRNGLQPQLALSYSTGNGNGAFGLGWSVSVPGVRRKTAKSIPRYAGSDVFVLSGAEDLVPVPGDAPGQRRFRPRTEGLFARITHHTGDAQDFWSVWSKDGLRSRYGSERPVDAPAGWRDPAVVSDPENPRRILAWLLTDTIDTAGNRMDYAYREDGHSAQRYLSEIRYADHGERTSPEFLVSIRFVYEPRPDPVSERRGGFEVRTTLRCSRIETWTHAGTPVLARTVILQYADQVGPPPANGASLLSRVVVTGHDGDQTQSLPPLEFGYTTWDPTRRRYQPFSAPGGDVPPTSLRPGDSDLVDLFGDGLPSVVQMNGVSRYWRNRGGARFDSPRPIRSVPAGASLGQAGVQLADMDGDGRIDLLVTAGTRAGFYPVDHNGGFAPDYVSYRRAPAVNLADPEVRLIDLSGDGAVDAVRTGASLELYYNDSNGKAEWSTAILRPRRDTFPVSFSDPRVRLADMSGDGLTDVVLVHRGRVDYWPHEGYGRWGPVVTMANAPRWTDASAGPAGYDPERLLVGDVDGDGCADLVYVGDGEVTVWVNRSGHSFADPVVIRGTPSVDNRGSVRLADMLGSGTAGILWTYDAGTQRESTYKFLDLTGGAKPYLLSCIDNHMGARTSIEYAPSTRYATADAKAGKPWRTTLPFPVQVVARTTVTEHFSASRMTSEFRYHHGYWDGDEREFRGFAHVDQLDAETFEDGTAPRRHSPPTEARTWFHVGPVRHDSARWGPLDLSEEYWGDDGSLLGDTDTGGLLDLPPGAQRDALRSLAGRAVRSELYGRDGDAAHQDRPYTVTEHRHGVAPVLDGRATTDAGWQARPVVFPHVLAERTTRWERGEDRLTTAVFTDRYDGYGRPAQTVEVAVPRGRDPRLTATPSAPYLATTTLVDYATRDDATRYVTDRVSASTRYELTNDGSPTLDQLRAGALDGTAPRRLLGLELTHYDGLAFEGLPVGQLGDHGLVVRSEQLAFTKDMLGELCPNGPPAYLQSPQSAWSTEYPIAFRQAMAGGAGYVWHDAGSGYVAGYYVQSRRLRLDLHDDVVSGRGLTVAERDALGNETAITYDGYRLLAVRVTDASGLATTADHNYQLLRPRLIADANGNRSEVEYTPLGLVSWTAQIGKKGQREGDTPAQPGTWYDYGLNAWEDSASSARQPIWVHTTRRVEHRWEVVRAEDERRASVGLPPMADAETAVLFPPDERERFPERFLRTQEFSDGLGRSLQSRAQWDTIVLDDLGLPSDVDVHPSDAVAREHSNTTAPSVAVSGWQAYDNKGRTVQAWEPFLDTGWTYQPPSAEALEHELASTVTQYDPRGNPVRVVHPDGSEDRMVLGVPLDLANPVVFRPSPWEVYSYDANDNAGRTHAGVTTEWSSHWNTPSSATVDALGRTVETVARTASERHVSKSRYDIHGRVLETWDALGRRASRSAYDLLGRAWVSELLDAGTTRQVLDAAGAVVERRDDKGALGLTQYDRARRPIRYWARDAGVDPATLRGLTLYGDDSDSGLTRAAAAASNLLGRAYRNYDEAGLLTAVQFDFAGNLVERQRQVLKTSLLLSGLPVRPRRVPATRGGTSPSKWRPVRRRRGGAGRPGLADGGRAGRGQHRGGRGHGPGRRSVWSGRWYRLDWQPPAGETLQQHTERLLEATVHQSSSRHDALGRRKTLMLPTDVSGKQQTLRFAYSRSGNLTAVDAGGSPFVSRILYNARNQRSLAVLGNGLMVRYTYDPKSFRLARLRSERFTQVSPLRWGSSGKDGLRQDHGYRHDLVGNLLELRDRTPACGTPPGDPDKLDRTFRCDALYRLVSATGRECKVGPPAPWSTDPRCQDLTATQLYKDAYTYDAVGNLLRQMHEAVTGSWTSQGEFTSGGNRLQKLTSGNTSLDYTYDACGNIVRETTSRHYEWDSGNRLTTFRVEAQGADPSEYTQYRYDAHGDRVLKISRDQSRNVSTTVYLDGVFERLIISSATQTTMHDTIHLLDDATRVALLRIGAPALGDTTPPVVYHLADHLGSSEIVTNATGDPVSREEFTAYGQTSFGAYARKRYRFTGKERDEESGLSYHGARYYAPWLARWISCDPAGLDDGTNLYVYASNNPLQLIDGSGLRATRAEGENSGRDDSTAHQAMTAGGSGLMKAAPRGPTLVVPESYDTMKMRAYGAGVVERRIGKVTNTKAIRRHSAHRAAESTFKKTVQKPVGMPPSGQWVADHVIELQHDPSGRSGTRAKDFRWQDRLLNSREGSQSRVLQGSHPGITGSAVLSGQQAPTIYGGITKPSHAGRWYTSPQFRGTVRGAGAGMTVYGAYTAGDAVANAVVEDALRFQETGGQFTAREVATQAAGGAAAAALGTKGAVIGAAIGAPFAGVGGLVGGAIGGLVGGAVGYFAGATVAAGVIEFGVQATGAENFVPADIR